MVPGSCSLGAGSLVDAHPPACLRIQIEEARRREQADKIAAINALERQSQEIMRHKQAMAALQTRISSMQSQLLVGGQKVEDTPQFRQVLRCRCSIHTARRHGVI